MKKPPILCPHCGHNITKFALKAATSRGGQTTGPSKARTHEQASKAARTRWANERAKKSAKKSKAKAAK
jgi:hypothetical protein